MVVMDPEGLSVGELAAATGLTVRTLHHYDSLGLVCPAERTAAGHRRYRPADVEQLYRVQALRALDLSLREVADLFATGTRDDLAEVVARQVSQVRERIERERDLLAHLEVLQEGLRSHDGHDTADLITTIARTTKLNQNLRHDYREQSNRYDQTRAASPSVLDPVRRALAGAPGRVLYDVGGGTGNYAAAFQAEGRPGAASRRAPGGDGAGRRSPRAGHLGVRPVPEHPGFRSRPPAHPGRTHRPPAGHGTAVLAGCHANAPWVSTAQSCCLRERSC
jgi:DNA-binding transcriptional MerR regulator